jgi:hypothetical protein
MKTKSKAKCKSKAKPTSEPAEIYGPHLPPNTQIVGGRLVGIPPVARSGDETKAAMDRVNNDRSIENRIMTERGPRFEPQPSDRNAASTGGFAGINADLTFSRIAGTQFGSSNYIRSRRVG